MPGYQGYLEVVLVMSASVVRLQAWDAGKTEEEHGSIVRSMVCPRCVVKGCHT